jgi:hypothetical protein
MPETGALLSCLRERGQQTSRRLEEFKLSGRLTIIMAKRKAKPNDKRYQGVVLEGYATTEEELAEEYNLLNSEQKKALAAFE